MTTATFFDTHRFVTNLSAKGFTVQQAEALAEEQVNLLDSGLVGKSDLAATEKALKGDLANTENIIRQEIAAAKIELIKWVVGMHFATIAILTALLKLT